VASTDAKPVPQKNVAYRVYFAILDADGDLVTGATALDSEVSKDGGTFADCTNEATEIATSSGCYYLDLTSTEMNADSVVVIVKTSSSGAKTTPIFIYPEEAGDIRVNVTAYGGTAGTFSSGRPEVNTTHAAGTAWASGAITAASIADNAIDAGAIAADAITAAKIADGAIDAATFAAGAITATVIATGAIDADAIAADAVTEIQSGLATAANLATVAGYLDTEVAAILEDTGTTLPAQIAALNNLSAADVNAQVLDVLNVDTFAEPGQGAPAATASLAAKINYLYKAWRNKFTQTSTEYKLYADDAATVDQKGTVVDDGSTFTRGEVGAGP
jgi:hypothetical protein